MKSFYTIRDYFPLSATLALLVIGGIFFLNRADAQARDTIRKHHIEDIERSLYAARSVRGTFPPYNEATWCGVLSDPKNSDVLSQVESGLRSQHEKYANPEKPFPSDPLYSHTDRDYFYWKRSPTTFELFSVLEQDQNNDRRTILCNNAEDIFYDYGVASIWREGKIGIHL